MNRKIVAALSVLAIAGGAFVIGQRSGLIGETTTAGLTLYGNVDVRTVDLGFRVGGRILDIPVEEGDSVAPGDVLARLDPVPLQQALTAAEAQVAAAGAARDKAVAGNRPQEIAQARATVAQREASLTQAQLSYDRARKLIASNTISQSDLDAAEAAYREAQALLQAAREALSLSEAGSRAEDIAAAEAGLAAAHAAREQAQTALEDATLRAAQAGTVMTRAREPGAIVAAGSTVFTLAIDRPLRVRAYVSEPDLGQVVPGRDVTLTTDSSDRIYHGTIGFVSPVAEFTPKSVQTPNLRTDLVFRLRITVSDPDSALRQGQPVTVVVPDDGA
ncbi:secretion protein HlyD [Pseudodonghicola flavimaris]|uniref:Secretion protein HlyD n=1 Tax=Pseudodonghicola flavimaris TaxID=3050036 RepID=A0ABT7F2T6_9RHOB|nr:secretion protein HlyD [Pseudodonghicola flavimaris]MDK3018897.1 secretion protein HlyD [Pseudodonghicola flavimaris]